MIKIVLAFGTGVAVGYISAKLILKEMYDNDLKAEEETIKAYYKKKYEKPIEEDKKEPSNQDKVEVYKTYSSLSSMYDQKDDSENVRYDNYSKEESERTTISEQDEPYWISKDQYELEERYSRMELIYYRPNNLLTDYEDVVVDIDSTIGFDCLREDRVLNGLTHARNDILRVVYEIEVKETSFADYYGE